MILVVNPNPAVDRVAVVDFQEKAALRPIRFSLWAGGSGVHAAYVAHLLGADVLVQGVAGGHSGARFRKLLQAQGLRAELVDIQGETRGTYSLLDAERGEICNVPEPGPFITPAEEHALEQLVLARLPEAEMLIVSGSVPPGCSRDLPARLVAAADASGVPCIADLAGDVLRAALPTRPWLIKPSRDEFAEIVATSELDLDTIVSLAGEWVRAGVANVCASLGAQGLLWISRAGAWHIAAPQVTPYNTIGCGDTLVGAVAATYTQTHDLAAALRGGVAAAAANIAYDAPGFSTAADIERLLPRTAMQAWPPRHQKDNVHVEMTDRDAGAGAFARHPAAPDGDR